MLIQGTIVNLTNVNSVYKFERSTDIVNKTMYTINITYNGRRDGECSGTDKFEFERENERDQYFDKIRRVIEDIEEG